MIDVLVVDDDFYVARINAHYVSEVPGFRVAGIAHSAAPALAAVERGGIDLILLDQHLPNESGLSLTRRLRQLGHDIDVIMVTADRRPASVREAMRAGVLHYLVKPFTSQGLRSKLESYAQVRGTIDDGGEMDQARIDRMLGSLHAPEAEHSMPKGYSERTAGLISCIVVGAKGQVSAQEVSEQARISRSTAQRYLKYLAETGTLEMTLRYGDSGRPEHMYSGS
ncbi:response regulator [Streptomyces sp. CB03911]|uniref:response regulator n=1 Tax=Streptomyces sp. CB03911 TaxID=1804758 RepID=UPI00093B6794|nr:response regulator [Streptomyces sp. CB03911]OKI13991.1 two-component system response regulator [Streptomyces sp. CB03911]